MNLIRVYNGGERPEFREITNREKQELLDAQNDRGKIYTLLHNIVVNKDPAKPGYPSIDGYYYGNTANVQFNHTARDK